MKLIINDLRKADQLITIFKHLKSFSPHLSLYFDSDKLYAQGMDDSHVALFELNIHNSWFDEYEFESGDAKNIAITSQCLFKALNMREDNQSIHISYEGDPDKIKISFESDKKEEFNKYFELTLIDLDAELMDLSNHDSQVDMEWPAKQYSTFIEQLFKFHTNVTIECSETNILYEARGDEGLMRVNTDIDDLIEYAIEEDKVMKQCFSLQHLSMITQFHKLSNNVFIGLCDDSPMLLKYSLDSQPSNEKDEEDEEDEGNYIKFYLAPKMEDDE